MALKLQLIERTNFAGGLNLLSDAFHVADDETADCLNVNFDIRGAVKKRGGYDVFANADNKIDFLLPFTTPDGVTRMVAAPSTANAIFQVSTGGAVSAISGATAQSAAQVHAGVVMKGAAYIINGTDQTAKWTGTTFTRMGVTLDATGNMPKAKAITVHKNRIFLGNTDGATNQSRIRYSGSDASPTDVEYYKSTSFIDVQPDDGDVIQQIVPYLDSLIIFKRNSVWTLRGNTPRDFQLVLGNPSLGCVAPRSVAVWDKGAIFLSNRGVFSFDGGKVVRLSEKIDPALNALSASALAKSTAIIFQQKYYLWVNELGTDAYPDTAYVFDFVTNTWTKYRSWNVTMATIWNRQGVDELYAADAFAATRVLRMLVGTSDGGGDNLLTANQAGIETDATGWANIQNSTLTQTAVQARTGTKSLQILATAGGDCYFKGSPDGTGGIPVNKNYTYTVSMWFRTQTTARSVKAFIRFYDGAGTFISDNISAAATVTDSSSGWTQATSTVTPANIPSNAVTMVPSGQIIGSVINEIHYMDDAVLSHDGIIDAYFTTKWMDFGVPERRKFNRRMYVWFIAAGNFNVMVDVQRNYASADVVTNLVNLSPGGMTWGSSLWGSSFWGTGFDIIRKKLNGLGTSPAIRVKVHDTSNNPWTLEGLAFVVQPRNLA